MMVSSALGLPQTASLCYKPYMRKWMRDKLKRRKKSEDDAGAKPAPLQPAYFEAEPGAEPPEAPGSERTLKEPSPEPAENGSTDAAEAVAPSPKDTSSQPVSQATDNARRPRRRRGRGGRGRRRPGQVQPATATTPASTAPSVPIPSVAAPQAQRPSKGLVILAVGLPGSGKSSWFKRHNITPLSSDMVRSLLFDDPAEQRFQDLVFSNLRSMLKARLIARRPMNYVDATNLTPQERHNWIKLANDFGYEVHAVFFDVPLDVCIERHQRRDRLVPEDVMRKMAAKLKPPTFDEGFAKITVVRVKQRAE
jgi:predicted kinase